MQFVNLPSDRHASLTNGINSGSGARGLRFYGHAFPGVNVSDSELEAPYSYAKISLSFGPRCNCLRPNTEV